MTGKKQEHLIPLPEGHEERPFVLVWAEKTALEKLKAKNLIFSEDVGGLEIMDAMESAESSGGPSEAADTTITF